MSDSKILSHLEPLKPLCITQHTKVVALITKMPQVQQNLQQLIQEFNKSIAEHFGLCESSKINSKICIANCCTTLSAFNDHLE